VVWQLLAGKPFKNSGSVFPSKGAAVPNHPDDRGIFREHIDCLMVSILSSCRQPSHAILKRSICPWFGEDTNRYIRSPPARYPAASASVFRTRRSARVCRLLKQPIRYRRTREEASGCRCNGRCK
jgi:hypothetical protein